MGWPRWSILRLMCQVAIGWRWGSIPPWSVQWRALGARKNVHWGRREWRGKWSKNGVSHGPLVQHRLCSCLQTIAVSNHRSFFVHKYFVAQLHAWLQCRPRFWGRQNGCLIRKLYNHMCIAMCSPQFCSIAACNQTAFDIHWTGFDVFHQFTT